MLEQGSDGLHLSGKLQIDTAIDALAMTDINPEALHMLQTLRDVHERMTTDEAQNDLHISLWGDRASAMRADITASTLLREQNETLSNEARTAARGLLHILGVKEP